MSIERDGWWRFVVPAKVTRHTTRYTDAGRQEIIQTWERWLCFTWGRRETRA